MRRRLLCASLPLLAALVVADAAAPAARPGVAALQVALEAKGLYRGVIDGIEGPQTERAVRRFQRRKGLVVDGVAGPQTRRALGRLGRPLFGRRVIRQGLVGWDVSSLQFRLRKRGFSPGAVDGSFGPVTARAVRRFQAARGLVADAVAGPATIAALRSSRARRARAPGKARVRATIDRWARHYGVSPSLARALAWQESGWQPHVRSGAGAWGVMQVTPATWRFVETVLVGHRVARTMSGNVRVGVAYLHHLLHSFRWKVGRALAAYYQGPRSVRRTRVLAETRAFVANVLALRGRV